MLIFLSVAIVIYGSMHFYALRKVWKIFPPSRAGKAGLSRAGVLLTLSPLAVRFLEKNDWHRAAAVTAWGAYTWMAYLILFFCVGLTLDLCRGGTALLKRRWPLSPITNFRIIGLLALALLGYGFFEAQHIRIERITVTTPKLKSGRITIAQISDLHLGVLIKDRFLKRVLTEVNALKPDIVVATGDIVDGQGDELNSLSQYFHAIKPPLGTYAVTGNHEYIVGVDHSLRFLRDAGFTMLRGDAVKTGGIVLVGVDDQSHANGTQKARTDARQALASVNRDDFVVLLKHRPVIDSTLPFDLQLSGHTHGGQIFPFSYPTRLINGVPTGLTQLDHGPQLYVSRGVGTWGPPIRLFSEPEITLITIEASPR